MYQQVDGNGNDKILPQSFPKTVHLLLFQKLTLINLINNVTHFEYQDEVTIYKFF